VRRSPIAFTVAVLAYIGAALAVEPGAGRVGVLAIGLATWLFLLAAVRALPRREAVRVGAVVAIATGGEVLGSLILGLYAYRRGGIPAFVPPGHGLVYLAGLRLSESPRVRACARPVALAAGAAWAALSLRHDVVGALAMVVLLAAIARGRPLYACMFAVVAALELYGTGIGTWEWARHWPGLPVAMGNPPSGVAAGYCAFDALALRLGPRLDRAWRPPVGMTPWRRTSIRAMA
jgi:hypothetical protein